MSAPAASSAPEEKKEDDAKEDEQGVQVGSMAMKLLDVTLKRSGAILQSLIADFLGTANQQLCLIKAGGLVELYQLLHTSSTTNDANGGVPLKRLASIPTHSILRQATTVRLTGEKRDLLALVSDAGTLALWDWTKVVSNINNSGNTTPPNIAVVVYGKTQCRRSTPGQYLASDPKGRAVLVSAVEKRKLVFVLNHSGEGGTSIASPLEAHRSRTLTVATVGVDNGYDNPLFACIEQPLPEESMEEDGHREPADKLPPIPSKQLVYYELDLGLNHVSRSWATTVPFTANCVAALPGGADGPSGVVVGHDYGVTYYHPDRNKDLPPLVCVVPRREWSTSTTTTSTPRPTLVQSIVIHKQKKSKFFGLIQTEWGDVFKLTVDVSSSNAVEGMSLALLDTLPVANSLNISKKGWLFGASECSDHSLYQFERIELPNAPTNHSKDFTGELTPTNYLNMAKTFRPTHLQNLVKMGTLDSPTPTTGVLVGELAGTEVSPQIYTLTGKGPTASLRILRHGASVTELAVSELPGIPGGIFSIANREEGDNHTQYIVVSFADATLVLSVGETGVEEVGKESGFLNHAPTLACSALQGGSLCQVHPSGVRHIQSGQAKQWNCQGLKRIECASANVSQVLIALAGGEVTAFELDSLSDNLKESGTRNMGADVCCLDVGVLGEGNARSLFAAIGCRDQTLRIISLEPGPKFLQQTSSTVLKSRPHSVSLQPSSTANGDMILMIGLDDGSCLRASVDPVTGAIGTSPTRRFLGARPVSVSRVQPTTTLLLSSRPWISHSSAGGKTVMAPLSYAPLDHGCLFSSEAVPDGVVATAGKTLRIISVDTAGMEGGDDEAFNTNKVSLRYTPRQMTLLSSVTTASSGQTTPARKVVLAVVESDYNDFGEEEKISMGYDASGGLDKPKAGSKAKDGDAMDMDEDSDDENAKKDEEEEDDGDDAEDKAARSTPIRGPVPSEPGHWGSCIRLLDPSESCRTLHCLEMNRNEAALCCCSVRFHTRGEESLLAVGTVTGMTMNPLKQASSHVVLYRVVNGDRLQLLHRTTIDDGPVLALAHFQGRLLVGIGKSLRLYEMGKRQLLRKCELRGLPTFVKTLQTAGDRAFFGDMMRSLHIVRYEATANRLVIVANDPSPRPIVCQELLDWNTIAVGDKFGNITILRLPRGADTTTLDLSGQRALWDSARAGNVPRLEVLCQYHVGEVVTSMTRSALVAGGAESLIYVTVTGRIGSLFPFSSRDDVDFYTQLEGHLRSDLPRPTGRDPQAYRSYYSPVMHIVDGDLCDAFNSLPHVDQSKIAEKLDRTVGEILKKLEDTRNALL